MIKLFIVITLIMTNFCTVALLNTSSADDQSEDNWARAQSLYYRELRKKKNPTPEEIKRLKDYHQTPSAEQLTKPKNSAPVKTGSTSGSQSVVPQTAGQVAPSKPSQNNDTLINPVPDADKIEKEITYGKQKNPKPKPSIKYQMIEVKSTDNTSEPAPEESEQNE